MSLFSVQVKMFKSKKIYIICLTSKYRRVHVSFFLILFAGSFNSVLKFLMMAFENHLSKALIYRIGYLRSHPQHCMKTSLILGESPSLLQCKYIFIFIVIN